jgi:hypothetical protein
MGRPRVVCVQTYSRMKLADLKDQLRISPANTSHDKQLTLLLLAAKECADDVCNRNFTGNIIPATIENWVKMQAASLFTWPVNGVYADSQPGFGVSTLKDRMDTSGILTRRRHAGF